MSNSTAIAPRKTQRRTQEIQAAIAEIIRDLPRGVHLTAPEVFRRARESGLKTSLSTVYRVLNNMQADGNVTTVFGDHGRRYEARDDEHDHDHLICVKCGYTVEFTDELIRGFGKTVAERKGYEHKSTRFDIFGICSECRAKDEDHKLAAAAAALESACNLAASAIQNMRAALQAIDARKQNKSHEALSAGLAQLQQATGECQIAADALITG